MISLSPPVFSPHKTLTKLAGRYWQRVSCITITSCINQTRPAATSYLPTTVGGGQSERMSDSDSYTTSGGGGENEGACGKLLEEIADQDQVVELDPIDVMLDKILSFCDLDKSLVSEEDRETLYKRLEQIGLEQETVLVMFETKNNQLVEVPLESDSDQPKSFLAKPAGHAIKV